MLRKYMGILLALCLTGAAGSFCNAAETAGTFRQPAAGMTREMAIPLSAAPKSAAGIDPARVQGGIRNVFYGADGNVLIEAGKLYLYDVSSGKALAETEREPFNQPRYMSCGTGFAAIGTLQGSLNGKIVFYNSQLAKESEISFAQITGSNEMAFSDQFALSPDGKKIAYCDFNGISVYDRAAKSRTRILSLEPGSPAAAEKGVMHVSQLLFADGGTLVLLLGVDGGTGQSIPACGKINVDGTGLVIAKTPGYVPYEITGAYQSFALFGEDDRSCSGRLLSLDAATGAAGYLPLSTTRERVAFGSGSGKYYASAAMDGSGCTIRVYETGSGKKCAEQFVSHGGNPLYVARTPVVRVLEQTKTCIVLMGNRQDDLTTKVTCFQF